MSEIPLPVLTRYEEFLRKKTTKVQCVPEPGYTYPHLRWMIEEIKSKRVQGEKSHRWLGFIQGILIREGHFNVTEERDFTRPYFNPTKRVVAVNHVVRPGDTPKSLALEYYGNESPGWRMIAMTNDLPLDGDGHELIITKAAVMINSGTINETKLELTRGI